MKMEVTMEMGMGMLVWTGMTERRIRMKKNKRKTINKKNPNKTRKTNKIGMRITIDNHKQETVWI